MKVVNLMNFVRQIDERAENSTERLFDLTLAQLRLANEYQIDHTFLLQYDVLCDERFVSMFRSENNEHTELGLWYEIVEPLTSACGIPYRSENGWKWDWHIVPGFSMAYTPSQRVQLIDEAMRKFKEIFGVYPKTIASWLIDTHTLNHLVEHYDIQAVAICRDQTNTDAYTLRGGYFNQGYYPSKNNIFTPAQSEKMQVSIPVFRLLGPCPIHNYDKQKYASQKMKQAPKACYTLEPAWYPGRDPHIVKCFFDYYYAEESLGFAYSQIGQENSFWEQKEQVLTGTRMQIEQLLARGDVTFMKMGDTGKAFKEKFPQQTPATSVIALKNWDIADAQSVYYDCKNYTANLFRFEDRIFIRSLFLFDERVKEHYLEKTCTTFDAIYENLPLIDTASCAETKKCGLMIDTEGHSFHAKKLDDGVLKIQFGEYSVTFFEDYIEVCANRMLWYKNSIAAKVTVNKMGLSFKYNEVNYHLCIEGAKIILDEDGNIQINPISNRVLLYPKRETLIRK